MLESAKGKGGIFSNETQRWELILLSSQPWHFDFGVRQFAILVDLQCSFLAREEAILSTMKFMTFDKNDSLNRRDGQLGSCTIENNNFGAILEVLHRYNLVSLQVHTYIHQTLKTKKRHQPWRPLRRGKNITLFATSLPFFCYWQ